MDCIWNPTVEFLGGIILGRQDSAASSSSPDSNDLDTVADTGAIDTRNTTAEHHPSQTLSAAESLSLLPKIPLQEDEHQSHHMKFYSFTCGMGQLLACGSGYVHKYDADLEKKDYHLPPDLHRNKLKKHENIATDLEVSAIERYSEMYFFHLKLVCFSVHPRNGWP